MSIKSEVLKYLRENRNNFLKKYGVKEIYIFGSVARGEDNEKSDIDLLVEFDTSYPLTLRRYFGLEEELKRVFKRKVDIVTKDAMKKIVFEYAKKDLINASK